MREEPPWQQLTTATHVAQQLAQDSATTKPHIDAWDQALHKNELQLLQLHIAATLKTPCQCCISFTLYWSFCCAAAVLSWHASKCAQKTGSVVAVALQWYPPWMHLYDPCQRQFLLGKSGLVKLTCQALHLKDTLQVADHMCIDCGLALVSLLYEMYKLYQLTFLLNGFWCMQGSWAVLSRGS